MKKLFKHKILTNMGNFNSTSNVSWNLKQLFRFTKVHTLVLCSLMVYSMQLISQTAEYTLYGVSAPTSGIQGNIDVHVKLTAVNNGAGPIYNVQLMNALAAEYGSTFVRVVPGSLNLQVSAGSPGNFFDINYDGVTNNNMLIGAGLLNVNDTICFIYKFELNPRAAGAPSSLVDNFTFTYDLLPIPSTTTSTVSNDISIPDCWSDCAMACNNNVNVSVNGLCSATIYSEMVLEGERSLCADLGFFQVRLFDGNKQVFPPLGSHYIGKKLRAEVRNIVCGNSCWGYVNIEDKTAPKLDCGRERLSCAVDPSPASLGYPVDVSQVNTTVYPYIAYGIDACGPVTLEYRDSVVQKSCSDTELSSILYRRWTATDISGYKTSCQDTFEFRRGMISDIILPPHYDDVVGTNHRPALQCDGSWTKFPNGFPDTTATGTGKPLGIFCGNIQFGFDDDTIQVCQSSYKLLRNWIIIDWCNPTNRINYTQLIKVVDNRAPIVICPRTITINTDAHTCTGSYILPRPENLPAPGSALDPDVPYVIENCSDWTYTVSHVPAVDPNDCTPNPGVTGSTANITRLPDGRFKVSNLAFGCNWIYYHFTDACGNKVECTFDIKVEDNVSPEAVCHQKTVISLTSDGKAIVPASVFDDGSHDNCTSVRFQARRMSPTTCVGLRFRGNSNRDSIEFCCRDIALSPIRVVMTVFDRDNNSSECMIDAYIQDKLPPVITCPEDQTILCTDDISNLSIFGSATAIDNCEVTIRETLTDSTNSCHIGRLIRTFTATDNGGRTDVCKQIITIVDPSPFTRDDIYWPSDVDFVGCTSQTDVNITGKPIFYNLDRCNQPIASYKDDIFNIVEGACYKILRKWTVIDWCSFDQFNPRTGYGIWYHTQVIKVKNSVAPDFANACVPVDICIDGPGCSKVQTLTMSATDDCTPAGSLLWSFKLDLNNDGSVNRTGNATRLTEDWQKGTHKLTWTVEDQCGNKSTCEQIITVRDCKPPTPYCSPGIVTVLMQNNGTVGIWASDYNVGSTDNCDHSSALLFSFSADVNEKGRTFTCADIPNGKSQEIELTVYVTDLSGNQDVCKTKIILQDNSNVCPDNVTGGGIMNIVAGNVKSENNQAHVEAKIEIRGGAISGANALKTDNAGYYAFTDIAPKSDYKVSALFDGDILNGVSTKDIVKIQKHILGIEGLNSAYKILAADVNNSKTVTAKDISDLRKVILGVSTGFPNNGSWRFVDAAHSFFDINEPFEITDEIVIKNIDKDMMHNDFISIKIGDVTNDAKYSALQTGSRTSASIKVIVDEQSYVAGKFVSIPLLVNQVAQLEGMQFTIEFDSKAYEFEAIQSGYFKVDASNYNALSAQSGVIAVSLNQIADQHHQAICKLVLKTKATGSVQNGDIKISSRLAKAEAYHTDGEDYSIQLNYRTTNGSVSDEDNQYVLYQNIPNPFTGMTNISFTLPIAEQVEVKLFDMSGKMLQVYSIQGNKGMNTLQMDLQESPINGVLYYQLDSKNFTSTRKMVVIK